MKPKNKIAILCMMILFLLSASSCSLGEKKIEVSGALSDDELFKIAGEVCSLSEAMIFIANQRNMYEDVYTHAIWSKTIEGSTYEEHLLNQMKSFLIQLKSIKAMAKKNNIQLTAEEEGLIAKAADTYYNNLTEEDIEFLKVTKEDVLEAYTDYCLANKVMQEVTKDVDVEISDDEAKVITVQQILVKTFTLDESGNMVSLTGTKLLEKGHLAEAILEKTKTEDFAILAEEYNEDHDMEVQFARGQILPELEKAAYSLEKEQISGIIKTDYGYYIIKCISDYDKEATQLQKKELSEERFLEAFQNEYKDFTKSVSLEFNTKLWDDIQLSGEWSAVTCDFFEIYNSHFLTGGN